MADKQGRTPPPKVAGRAPFVAQSKVNQPPTASAGPTKPEQPDQEQPDQEQPDQEQPQGGKGGGGGAGGTFRDYCRSTAAQLLEAQAEALCDALGIDRPTMGEVMNEVSTGFCED